MQSVYGTTRYLNGDGALAWAAQGATTSGVAIIMWFSWRSRNPYALKAATLSAAALIATPYVLAYDLAAIAIPVAFLAKDAPSLPRSDQWITIALFILSLSVIPTVGQVPVGLIMLTLYG